MTTPKDNTFIDYLFMIHQWAAANSLSVMEGFYSKYTYILN